MTPSRHHPDPATIMSFAAGSLPEPFSVVVAAHMALCPPCARALRLHEDIGAELLDALAGAPLSGRTPHPLAAGGPDQPRGALGDAVATPLDRLLANPLAEVAWRRLGVGIWHVRLPLADATGGDLRLLKIGPGRLMPEHGHGGSEMTLVLSGAYADVHGRFGRGDIEEMDETGEHRPHADAATGCICLIASARPARFKGLVSRLLQPLTGM